MNSILPVRDTRLKFHSIMSKGMRVMDVRCQLCPWKATRVPEQGSLAKEIEQHLKDHEAAESAVKRRSQAASSQESRVKPRWGWIFRKRV